MELRLLLLLLLPSATLGVVSLDDVRLVRARHRAEELAACVDAQRGTPYIEAAAEHKFAVISCPAANLTYAHVYKSAGTTLMHVVWSLCNGRDARLFRGWANVTSQQSTLDEIASTTLFTFVREPVSRFQSALFEISTPKRTPTFIRQMVQDAFQQNRTVASVVIDYLLVNRGAPIENDHLRPQVDFLTHMGRALPVTYVGVLTHLFHDELGSIVAAASSPSNVSSESASAVKGRVQTVFSSEHSRNHLDQEYSEGSLVGPFGPIHDEVLDETTRAKIRDFYRVDYECLGLA